MSLNTTRAELLKTINFAAFYDSVGCKNDETSTQKWVPCLSHASFGGTDTTPSASFNSITGHYKDFRTGFTGTLFDFAAKIGLYPDWQAAVAGLAKQYNLPPPTDDGLKPHLLEWNDCLVYDFLAAKPPCTLSGLSLTGAAIFSFRNTTCLGWSVYKDIDTIVGLHLVPRNGKPFPKNQKSHTTKKKGQENGLIGLRGFLLAAEDGSEPLNVFWTEGVSDLVAIQGYLGPDTACVTNPNGCSEAVTPTQIAALRAKRIQKVYVVSDSDAPGLKGAVARTAALVAAGVPAVAVVVPYDITPDHGKDLRDLITQLLEHKPYPTYEDAQETLLRNLRPITPEVTVQVEKKAQVNQVDQVLQLMQRLGLHIIGKTGKGGTVVLYCSNTGQSGHFSLGCGHYAEMVAVCGVAFLQHVTTERTRVNGLHTMDDFRTALALYMSLETQKQKRLLGAGVWRAQNDDLLLVSDQQICQFANGALGGATPVQGNLIADLNCGLDWLLPETLVVELALAQDPVYRIKVFHDVVNIVNTWPWAEPHLGELAVGLLCATLIQDLWDWRPTVVVTGESATGKTSLFKLFRKLCLGLAIETANTTVAGIIQTVQGNSSPLFIDEIDQRNTKEQQELLKMLRLSSQGQSIRRGTAGQIGKSYHVKHLAWLAGISTASTAQADLNRQIDLPLVRRDNGRFATPTDVEIVRLGWALLGSVLVVAHQAVDLARALQMPPDGVGGELARLWESRVVPCAMRAAVHGSDIQEARAYTESIVLPMMTTDVETSIHEASDHNEAILAILSKPLTVRTEYGTIANNLFEVINDIDHIDENMLQAFGHAGIAFVKHAGERYLAIDTKAIVAAGGLLGGHEVWMRRGGLKPVLLRLVHLEAKTIRCHIAGHTAVVIAFPIANLLHHYNLAAI